MYICFLSVSLNKNIWLILQCFVSSISCSLLHLLYFCMFAYLNLFCRGLSAYPTSTLDMVLPSETWLHLTWKTRMLWSLPVGNGAAFRFMIDHAMTAHGVSDLCRWCRVWHQLWRETAADEPGWGRRAAGEGAAGAVHVWPHSCRSRIQGRHSDGSKVNTIIPTALNELY